MVPPAYSRFSITALQNTLYVAGWKKPRNRGKRPVWDSGNATSKICSDGSAVLQIAKERPKSRYHQLGPHRTQLMRVTRNESGDVRCTQRGEVRSPIVKSLGQELLNDGNVVEQ